MTTEEKQAGVPCGERTCVYWSGAASKENQYLPYCELCRIGGKMNDKLEAELRAMLDDIANESRWAGDFYATGHQKCAAEYRIEAEKEMHRLLKFVDEKFVERENS